MTSQEQIEDAKRQLDAIYEVAEEAKQIVLKAHKASIKRLEAVVKGADELTQYKEFVARVVKTKARMNTASEGIGALFVCPYCHETVTWEELDYPLHSGKKAMNAITHEDCIYEDAKRLYEKEENEQV